MMPKQPLALLACHAPRSLIETSSVHVVVSVAPFLFNEGVWSAVVYPQDGTARLGVADQMRSFLPLPIER